MLTPQTNPAACACVISAAATVSAVAWPAIRGFAPLHGISDLVIGASYLSIAATLPSLVKRARPVVPRSWILVALGFYLAACAAGHFMEALTPWASAYWFAAPAKALAAVGSVAVAVVLPRLGPRILAMLRLAREHAVVEQNLLSAHHTIRCMNERLASRVGELETMNADMEAFSYSVSHDLRAPLRQVNGYARILLQEFGPRLETSAQHYLQRVYQGTEQMALLIDDLLQLGRIGRQEINRQITGLHSLVEEVRAELGPETRGRNIEWRIGQLPFVEADPGLLKQVFSNLLSNAAKFTRTREQAVIEVRSVVVHGQPAVMVRDNGVGFNMKYAGKLFGVFQRLHRTEDFEGTGVGLATVARIIQKHGGRIWAEAELDHGATFYFTLASATNGSGASMPEAPVTKGEQTCLTGP